MCVSFNKDVKKDVLYILKAYKNIKILEKKWNNPGRR